MSVNHASMATHAPQSLPSFAQAFSNHSLSNISSANNALPPIQARSSTMDRPPSQRSPPPRALSRPSSDEDVAARTAGRKRPHTDIVSGSRDDVPSDSDRASPNAVRVKEETDQDMLAESPPPQESQRPAELRPPPQDTLGAPSPSSTMPSPMKRRRMTVTGAPHALNIDVRVPPTEASSTPISPVVMGFTLQRDNPKEVEQVKAMISVKQKQKALIEQRRGSLAGAASSTAAPPPSSEVAKGPAGPIRGARRSPSGGAGTRRLATSSASQVTGTQRPPSPNVSTFQMQQSMHLPHQSAHTLPPPPISFAKRRAAQLGTKRKPADIVISPRDRECPDQFQPSIQSAPPTQGAFYSGRYPTMALPRLPNAMAEPSTAKRPIGHVPPTPTRLSQHLTNPPSIHVSESTPRSPIVSVPIASSLVPPTPAFHQTEHATGDKAAFLAPFVTFYNALNDAKQLKTWLGEQLQRSNSLFQSLSHQQEKLHETIEGMVERKLSGIHAEMTSLRRRVVELEEALRDANAGHGHRSSSIDAGPLYHTKSLQNGYASSSSHLAPDSYQFPLPDHSRLRSDLSSRVSSPRGHERDGRGMQHESERDSSVPFDSRRSTASAVRLEPPRGHHDPSSLPPPHSHSRISHAMQSPPLRHRDSPPSHSFSQAAPSAHGKVSRVERERPSLTRQMSHGGSQDRDREREHAEVRGGDSRRNSIAMPPPDHRMEES